MTSPGEPPPEIYHVIKPDLKGKVCKGKVRNEQKFILHSDEDIGKLGHGLATIGLYEGLIG